MIAGADKIAAWRDHPAQMVEDLFGVYPDAWQTDVLEAFPHKPRIAMQACAGPGKTAVLAWLGWNFMLTRPHPRVGVTSITRPNLNANLWAELAYWRTRSDLLQHVFELTKSEIYARDHPETWKLEARSWAADADERQIGNALRGLHSRYVMWLTDETGDYPAAVMPTMENIFAGSPMEAHIVQAGNPTKLEGPLYHAATHRDIWHVVEITADPDDPQRTPRVSIEHAREQIKQYGADNPWVIINIFGRFPPASPFALIGIDEVRAAQRRVYRESDIGHAPKILGVDVARQGLAQSVICSRQGLQMFNFKKYRNLNAVQGAGQVNRVWQEFDADACFIDMTGGFGAGWFDQLQTLRRTPMGVQFAGEAHNKTRYVNKRSEMAFDFVEWIKRGGAIPDDEGLMNALLRTNYTFQGDRFILEPKEDVEKKVGASVDEFDAAMLTLAEPVSVDRKRSNLPKQPETYQPFAELDRAVRASYGTGNAASGNYDPFRA